MVLTPWDKATDQERRFPQTRIPNLPADLIPAIAEADRETTHYTPVYLDTKSGVFDVEGYVPKEAILDTGATKVMFRLTFAATLAIHAVSLHIGT